MVTDPSAALPAAMVINGEKEPAGSAGVLRHVNPATGRVQAVLPLAGTDEVDRAVAAARAALKTWSRWAPGERRRALYRLASLMRGHSAELQLIHTLEAGIPVMQAPWGVSFGIEWLEDTAGWADKLYGEVLAAPGGEDFSYSIREPIGVVGAITTWNGSVGAFGMAAGPALAAGCTVVVKPSDLAPFGPIRCAELCLEAGIPPGVVNVLPGDAAAGQALVTHPGVDKITFTGSPPTARRIAAACAETLKPCVFELGGKSASIVCQDADIGKAVAAAVNVVFNAGQQCTLGSRLIVHERIHDEFVDQLGKALSGIVVGDPLDKQTMMGPVISRDSCERIMGLIDRARAGGFVRAGGERLGGELSDGFFIAPTLIDSVSNGSEVARTEVFGPVLAAIGFADDDEAVAIANDSEYGLAGYIFSQDIDRIHHLARALDTENIGVNGGWAPAGSALPFGGRKASGYGKQGGLAGVEEFTHNKTVQIKLVPGE